MRRMLSTSLRTPSDRASVGFNGHLGKLAQQWRQSAEGLRIHAATISLSADLCATSAGRQSSVMAQRYNSGSRDLAIRRMAECAIRDREAMIDAITPRFGAVSKENADYIEECRGEIADFKRIARSTLNASAASQDDGRTTR